MNNRQDDFSSAVPNKVKRDLSDLVLFLGSALFLSGLTFYLWFDGKTLWAVVSLIGSIIMLFTAYMTRSALCPVCGSRFKILTIDRCAFCDTYYRLKGDTLQKVGPGTIEAAPTFAVRLESLPSPRRFIWPDVCCVCGAKPEKYSEFKITTAEGYAAGGTMIKTVTYTFMVPYCTEHTDGVANGSEHSTDGSIYAAILFRSYDYRCLFMIANGVSRPQQTG